MDDRVAVADDPRQEPREAVLGREIQSAMGGGELGVVGRESQIAPAREHQPRARGRAVDGRHT